MSPYGAVNFTTGPVDSEALSTGLCPSYKLNHGQPIGRALCVGDGLSPSYWDPADNCGRNLTADEQLILLEETPVTIDNVADIAESTSELTSSSESLTSDGVASVSRLLEDIAEARSPEPAVCGFVIETVQNILSASPDELAGAQTESGATSRAVASLEEQLFIVDISASNGTYRRVEENLAVEVVELSPEILRSGLSASLTVSGGSDKIAADDFKLLVGEETDVDDEPDALIDLPSEIGDVISAGDNVRCSFTTFADPALFQSPSLAVNENSTGPYRTANSPVISATVGGSVINGLTEPVVVSFKPLNPNATNATCVFWDFEANNGTGDWSTEGCRLSNTSTDSRPVCQCDHLTNFAVLMDIYGGSTLSDREDFILEILSYVGCSMSVFGLVITMITYLSNRKFRMKNPNQILLCLCFSLLGLYVTFLTMIALDAERGVVEVSVIPCSIVAGLLHFFTLSSLAWMCVEGFNMYLMFVRVVDSYVSNFILKASFCAWGLPAVVVFITAGVTRDTYAQTDFCFVSLWPQVGGLLIPIGLILLFNVVVFALVMKRLTKTVRGKQQNEKAERRQRIRRFQNAISILLLMGLTWSVGYLSLIQATSVVVQGIFTVLNSLQGYFIFMLYCVRQPQVRRQWRAQFSCCLPESLRVSLDSSTSRFSSTVNTRTTTTWKPNNQPSKKALNTVSKFNPNSVPTSTTENLGSRMYNDRI
nr:adhesion G-protein coupled receptor G2-like [Lytechinus pictus]